MKSPATPLPARIRPSEFQERLLAWYDGHARDLPWRKSRDPYPVWVSEIMLQQTRVAAVIEHYREFLRRFPTVEKLAAARQSAVLAAWSGLGYYRRARMLHSAAKMITREKHGIFPKTASELQMLPGVGRYTSAAIASICFGEGVAVVDGNVERVLARLLGNGHLKGNAWDAAQGLLDQDRPGDFNQAMMELGATVCTPRAPFCQECPLAECCVTRGEGPSKAKGPTQRRRRINYILESRDGAVFVRRRPPDVRLMPGMWELPELQPIRAPQKRTRRSIGQNDAEQKASLLFTLRHSITVTDYAVGVWGGTVANNAGCRRVSMSQLRKLPLTGLARKILRKAKILL